MLGITSVDRRTILKGTTAAALGSLFSGNATARGERGENSPDDSATSLIAHRGFAGRYPENTVGAVENASTGGKSNNSANRGADMIEIDVIPCGGQPYETDDFEVVVFHDNRMADRDGGERGLTDHANTLVWNTPCAEVRNAEVLESGETIPTLAQVLDAIPSHVGVNIELKNPGHATLGEQSFEAQVEIWEPFTEAVLDIASRFNNHILVSSFSEAALKTTRDVDPSIPIAYLFWDDIEAGLEITEEYECEALHPPYNMIKGTPFFNDEYYFEPDFADVDLVEWAHERDLDVNTWSIDTWYQAEQLVDAGVDGIIANYPSVLDRDN